MSSRSGRHRFADSAGYTPHKPIDLRTEGKQAADQASAMPKLRETLVFTTGSCGISARRSVQLFLAPKTERSVCRSLSWDTRGCWPRVRRRVQLARLGITAVPGFRRPFPGDTVAGKEFSSRPGLRTRFAVPLRAVPGGRTRMRSPGKGAGTAPDILPRDGPGLTTA